MALLNEILNTPSAGGDDDFSMQWQSVFGAPGGAAAAGAPTGGMGGPAGGQVSGGDDGGLGSFMPSSLLDMTRQMGGMSMQQQQQPMPGSLVCMYSLPISSSFMCNDFWGKTSSIEWNG